MIPVALRAVIWKELRLKPTVVLLLILLISMACSFNYGSFSNSGLLLLTVALAVGLILLPKARSGALSKPVIGVSIVLMSLMNLMPAYLFSVGRPVAVVVLVSAMNLGGLRLLSDKPWRRRMGLLLAGGADCLRFLIGINWGRAGIDVFDMLQGGSERLLHGLNPYTGIFPSTTPGVRTLHLAYNASTLILMLPGRLLGDVRVSELLITAVLLLVIFTLAKRHLGEQQAWWLLALALVCPFLPYMVVQAWVEEIAVTGVALWLLWRDQHPRVAVIPLAIGLSGSLLTLPLLAVLYCRHARMSLEITVAAVLALLAAIPFALWTGPGAYLHDVLLIQITLPWRHDALGLNALWGDATGVALPVVISFGIPACVLLVLLLQRRRIYPESLMGGSLLLMTFVLFAKFAFFNYYYMVAFGMFLALAIGYGATEASRAGLEAATAHLTTIALPKRPIDSSFGS
jgi:hypothetical protein